MDRHALILAVREAALTGEASRKGLRQVVQVLEWAEAYVGKGIASGVYDGCAVPAPRALEYINEARAILDGCYEGSPHVTDRGTHG